jgi:hypothetical protein
MTPSAMGQHEPCRPQQGAQGECHDIAVVSLALQVAKASQQVDSAIDSERQSMGKVLWLDLSRRGHALSSASRR